LNTGITIDSAGRAVAHRASPHRQAVVVAAEAEQFEMAARIRAATAVLGT
jgi:hypothetical protein